MLQITSWVKEKYNSVSSTLSDQYNAVSTTISNQYNAVSTAGSNAASAAVSYSQSSYESSSNWFKEKYNSVSTTLSDQYSAVSTSISNQYNAVSTAVANAYNTMGSYAQSGYDYAKSGANLMFTAVKFVINPMQFWQGFSRFLDIPRLLPAFFNSPKTRRVLGNSFSSNILLYMGSVLFYQAFIKRLMFEMMPGMKDSSAEIAMDVIATWYFMRSSLRMLVNNGLYTTALVKAVSEENPNTNNFPSCNDGTVALVQTNIESPIYYSANVLLLNLIAWRVPLAKILTTPLLTYVYGQALAEYNLTGLCKKDRYRKLAENNSFVLGLGASFMMFYALSTEVIKRSTGASGYFINEAVFNFIFQGFIALTMLMNEPYPGKEAGKDLFYYYRAILGGAIKEATDLVIALLRMPTTTTFWTDLGNAILNSPYLDWVKMPFLHKDLQSLDSFVKAPAMKLFFDMRGDEIQGFLEWLIELRKEKRMKRLAKVVPYLPNFIVSPQVKSGLAFLVEKKMNGMLEAINNFIEVARLKVNIHDKTALQQFIAQGDEDIVEWQQKPALEGLKQPEISIVEVTETSSQEASLPEVSDFVVVENDEYIDATTITLDEDEEPEDLQNDSGHMLINNKSIAIIDDYKNDDDDLNTWTMLNEPAKKSYQTNSLFRKPSLPTISLPPISLSSLKKFAFRH